MIKDHELIDIFIGVDVGKSNHHAVAIDRTGRKLLDRALPQDESKLRAIIQSVAGKGRVLLVVDQPSTIGALPVAVAQAEGILVGYLPGLAMRRIADLHPGEAKTDVLTELTGPTRGNCRRRRFSSARFCSHEQRREYAAGTVRAGGAAGGCAEDHRQSLRAVSAG